MRIRALDIAKELARNTQAACGEGQTEELKMLLDAIETGCEEGRIDPQQRPFLYFICDTLRFLEREEFDPSGWSLDKILGASTYRFHNRGKGQYFAIDLWFPDDVDIVFEDALGNLQVAESIDEAIKNYVINPK